jgi:hypothetical protein
MRLTLSVTLATATLLSTMLSSTPGFAQRQYAQTFCIAGRGCVPTSNESYNACFQLALQRGLSVSRGDLHNLNSFIYQCLEGRIPR